MSDEFTGAKTHKFTPPWRVCSIGLGEFLAMDIKPREMILDPVIPTQGLTMIYSPRGHGKTFFALGMAYAVATGGAFLRWAAPKARRCLYIDGEMPASVMQERLAAMVAANGGEPPEPDYLRLITPDLQEHAIPDLATEEGQMAIGEHLDGVELILTDNLSTLCRSGRENEGDSWMPVQTWALDLRRRGISIVFVHHAGKSGAQRGTSKREDVLDIVLALRHPGDYQSSQGCRVEVTFEKSRGVYGEATKPFEAQLTTFDGAQTWAMKDLEESLTEQVANLLNDGVPQNEIADLLGCAKGTVSKHARKARAQGLVNDA